MIKPFYQCVSAGRRSSMAAGATASPKPWRHGFGRLACLGFVCLLPVAPATAEDINLDPFVGQYVGKAEVFGLDGQVIEHRDMDIEIERYHQDGLRIRWYNVTLVDGRRDALGVRRKSNQVTLVPHDRRDFFIEAIKQSPFRERKEASALAGDPVRWAVVEDGVIDFYSFQKLPDNSYELQAYTRSLNDIGLDLIFERIVDGNSKRTISGRAVRAGD